MSIILFGPLLILFNCLDTFIERLGHYSILVGTNVFNILTTVSCYILHCLSVISNKLHLVEITLVGTFLYLLDLSFKLNII